MPLEKKESSVPGVDEVEQKEEEEEMEGKGDGDSRPIPMALEHVIQDRPVARNPPVDPSAQDMIIKRAADMLNYGAQASIIVLLYPYENARLLIQVGYEPIEPIQSNTLFRRPCLLLPNIFQYLKYIKSVDGILGCYRGLVPYLIFRGTHAVLYKLGTKLICEQIAQPGIPTFQFAVGQVTEGEPRREPNFLQNEFRTYLRDMGLDLLCRGIVISITYPLRLIAIHAMAGIVEREPVLRRGVFGIVKEIWNSQGISGFFNGLTPRLIGEGIGALSIGLFTYFIRDSITHAELRWCLQVSLSVLTSTLAYPYYVVSSMMALNGGCSSLGRPPCTPIFSSWVDCWNYLRRVGQNRRGANLLFRYYTGPIISVNGVIRPSMIYFGPNFSKDMSYKRG